MAAFFNLDFDLILFTKKWHNIDDYFLYLRQIREDHLKGYDPNFYNKFVADKEEQKRKDKKAFKIKYL
jgi:hypothetical protein